MENLGTPLFMNLTERKKMTRKQIVDMFSEVYETRKFRGPSLVADTVSEHFEYSRRSTIRILDVAGGTGNVAVALRDKGFTHMDWLDPSEGMKKETLKKNVYTNYLMENMDGNRIEPIPTDTYDCLTITAGFNEGLLPCAAFKEMVRIVKPGGIICFGITKYCVDLVPEYAGRLDPLLDQMEEIGTWECLSKRVYDDYFKGDKTGIVYCYRVKVSETQT